MTASLARGAKLRIALIGVLAEQKGAPTVRRSGEATDPETFDLRLIGYPEQSCRPPRRRIA